MDWQTRLISLYVFICDQHHKELGAYCQRFTNNNKPVFTDEEVVTIFIFGLMQKNFEVKTIYNYTADHLGEWFPHLPSYGAFIQRINRLATLFPVLVGHIVENFSSSEIVSKAYLTDSFPVVMASAGYSSKARVAKHFANKGYCASKKLWYYGVKVHILGLKRNGTLPRVDCAGLTPASEHDLTAFKQIVPSLRSGQLYADLAYSDDSTKQLLEQQGIKLFTPVKKKKGQKFLDFSEQIFSSDVSRIRQPIESLFNWIQEKTNIQKASKIRSFNGLMVHVFGRIAAAMYIMAFDS